MIDLQPFCSTDRVRVNLQKPFSRGEFTYATNGHVAIRVPRLLGIDEQETPAVEKIFEQYFDTRAKGILEVTLPPLEIKKRRCRECDGSGREHECPDCDCECENCDGLGKEEIRPRVSVKIGDAVYDAYYLKQLMALPGLRFPISPSKENAAPFVFDGGDGLLMPMRYAEGETIVATVAQAERSEAATK